MVSILKTFGLGLLCTILSPLILLILVLYFIYTLLGVVVMFGISVYRYFAKGGSVLDELKIEKEAKKILQSQEEYNQKMRESALRDPLSSNVQPVNPSYNVPPINPPYPSQSTPTYSEPIENPPHNNHQPINNTYQEPEVNSTTNNTDDYDCYNTSPDDQFGGDL